MKEIVITNNPLIRDKLNSKLCKRYYDVSFLKILEIVRDEVHSGAVLLTHPLSSSLKPNETPYKSVIISGKNESKMDLYSLSIIEGSIETTKKFLKMKKLKDWNEDSIEDFQVVDFSLIESAIKLKE